MRAAVSIWSFVVKKIFASSNVNVTVFQKFARAVKHIVALKTKRPLEIRYSVGNFFLNNQPETLPAILGNETIYFLSPKCASFVIWNKFFIVSNQEPTEIDYTPFFSNLLVRAD